jgi:bile acid-coenzyme A ligase
MSLDMFGDPPPSGTAIPMGDLLLHHARSDPGRIAIIAGDQRISFADLDARANRRARILARHGVGQDDVVTIAIADHVDFYATSFAIWKLGATPNVVPPRGAKAELSAIIDIVRPRLFVADAPVPGSEGVFLHAGALAEDGVSAESIEAGVARHWKAMTSGGSTGRPKVIVDAAPALWNPTEGFLGQRPGDVILNPGPLYHNAPFYSTHAGLFVGCTIVDMGKFDAAGALDLIERHGVNWVTMVPTMMHRIWQLGPEVLERHGLPSLRMLIHMAAPCAPWLKQAFIGWLGGDRLWEYYGSTEGIGSTIITGADWLAHPGSVGRVRPGYAMRILDEDGQDCPPGTVGEIFFRPDAGPGSSYRYLGSEAMRRGAWEAIGDLGRVDEQGYLYLSDRRHDLIISGGANIYPAEIEAAIDEYPGVQASAAIGLPDEEWGASVHAIVQPAPGHRIDADALQAFLGDRLARYKLPRTIEISDAPLRDEAGKIRRAALRDARVSPTSDRN